MADNPQVTVVPEQEPEQSQSEVANFVNPYNALWWTNQTITNIPSESVGWLVAQGWQITGTSEDDSTVPSTISYSMSRESLQNWLVLLSLLNSYTTAWNTAKEMNEYRYNEVVENWDKMLDSSQVHFGVQTTQQNALVDLFLGDLDTYMDTVEALVTANETSMAAAVAAAVLLVSSTDGMTDIMTAHASEYDTLVGDLLQDYADYKEDFSAILDLLPGDYNTYNTDYSAVLDVLPTEYDTFDTAYSAPLDNLPTDYDTYEGDFSVALDELPGEYNLHAINARGFLTDLGATELARINEKFAASLATQSQQLTDRGLYSSAVLTDITARNTRDRNEEIAALNDRLAREKLENQHRLFEQQAATRGRTMDGTDRLYDRQTTLRTRTMDGTDRLYDRQTTVRGRSMDGEDRLYERQIAMRHGSMNGEDKLYDRQVAMRHGTMDGKDRLHTLKQELLRYRVAQELQNAEAIVEHKHKAIVELMSTYQARLAGLQGMHADNMKLMAYQLDVRNQMLIGLYGFVERREDVYPSFNDMTQLVSSMADSGGGWLTP